VVLDVAGEQLAEELVELLPTVGVDDRRDRPRNSEDHRRLRRNK